MPSRPYPDEIWHGFRWTWAVHKSRSRDLLDTVDATVSRAFNDDGYAPQTGDDYVALISGHYNPQQLPDMTYSFSGPAGAFATCFKCERETRGLHIHALTQDKGEASRLLNRVQQKASIPALKVALLRDVISELTWNHKLTIVSVVFTLLGTVVTLTTSFELRGILMETVRTCFGIAITISVVYIIIVLMFMVARAYYASRLVSTF